MSQETPSVMTPYEIMATLIAISALLQPWIIKLLDHFFRRIRLTFIPSAKIKLYYNRSGAYIYLGGVIESKNKAAVVKDIAVKIIRKKDKAELVLDWSSFMIPVFQSIGGNAVSSSEIARPFKVEAGSLCPVFIEFGSTNIQEIDRLSKIYSTMTMESQQILQQGIMPDQAKKKRRLFLNRKIIKNLKRNCWKIFTGKQMIMKSYFLSHIMIKRSNTANSNLI